MRTDLPEPDPGGYMDIPLEGSGYIVRVRGKCGPAEGELDSVTFLDQVHGASILHSPAGGEKGDGMVFHRGGPTPGLRVADCLPLLMVSTTSTGAAHCGWRGIAGGIVTALLGTMMDDPVHIMLGPRICPACYRVGEDVRQMVTESDPWGGQGHPEGALDLGLTVRRQILSWLDETGRDPDGTVITDIRMCTCCQDGHFHSWRREGTQDRNLVWLAAADSIAEGMV
jgi:copper oxidase (laccase) domain-containing protein